MRFIAYRHNNEIKIGAQLDGWVVDLRRAQEYLFRARQNSIEKISTKYFLPESMINIVNQEETFVERAENTLRAIKSSFPNIVNDLKSAEIILRHEQITYEPPLGNPGKLICVGMNYPSMGDTDYQVPAYPVLFLKSNSTLTGHRQSIKLPRISSKVVCEGELAIVIGKQGKHIPIELAHSYIAGLTIANDVGAQDLEQRTSQWATGKLPDTFTPMGPELVTSDQVSNPGNLNIKTHINGELVQFGNTRDMIFTIPYLISYISTIATLFSGDIILTGSPKNIIDKPAPGVYLKPGDNISVEIEGLGVLSNQTILEE